MAPLVATSLLTRRALRGSPPNPFGMECGRSSKGDLAGAVLDAGSGGGGWLRRVMSKSAALTRVASVDLVDSGASGIQGVDFQLADLSRDRLPFDDSSFDWVFALEVMEHLANPRHFVTEVARILKPHGRFMLTTPSNDCITSRLSLLMRGYFPAFNDRDYRESGHITPILELDLRRMATEANYSNVEFFFPLEGRLPKLKVTWQHFLPNLRGKLWSDSLFCRMTK